MTLHRGVIFIIVAALWAIIETIYNLGAGYIPSIVLAAIGILYIILVPKVYAK